jgi:putative transposase
MSRRNRFAPPNHWLHITQRGNDKERIFLTHPDRQTFLQLLEQRSEERRVHIAAYAVMSNHFHLVAKGGKEDAISLFMTDVNGLYAAYRNRTHRHSGRVGQGRFYAAVLAQAHFATALRYVELNPVRARLVKHAGTSPGPPPPPISDSSRRPNGSISRC